MFSRGLRLCSNRQIVDNIRRQISKTTSVTNSDAIVNITTRQGDKVNTEENAQVKKLLKLKKYHRLVRIASVFIYVKVH